MQSRDFLTNTTFINWQLTRDAELGAYWDDYLESRPEERQAFQQAVDRFKWVRLNEASLEPEEKDGLWDRITASAIQARKKRTRRKYISYAAAACVAALIGITTILNQPKPSGIVVNPNDLEENIRLMAGEDVISIDNKDHLSLSETGILEITRSNLSKNEVSTREASELSLEVPYGKQTSLSLPDGSRIWLNSGSTLKFPSRFFGSSREISLEGEIYIEVAENTQSPFIVHTPNFDVEVVGTEFNVSAYNDSDTDYVVLVEGEVEVENSGSEPMNLQPNQMMSYSGREMKRTHVETSRYTTWKDGYLSLEDTPVEEVLTLLERYYNVTFTYDQSSIEDVTCTGKIYLSRDIENVITTLSLITRTDYHIMDRDGNGKREITQKSFQ